MPRRRVRDLEQACRHSYPANRATKIMPHVRRYSRSGPSAHGCSLQCRALLSRLTVRTMTDELSAAAEFRALVEDVSVIPISDRPWASAQRRRARRELDGDRARRSRRSGLSGGGLSATSSRAALGRPMSPPARRAPQLDIEVDSSEITRACRAAPICAAPGDPQHRRGRLRQGRRRQVHDCGESGARAGPRRARGSALLDADIYGPSQPHHAGPARASARLSRDGKTHRAAARLTASRRCRSAS